MKQFYFSILFLSFSLFVSAQTNPTGTSAETGVTTGDLAVTLSGGASYSIPIAVPPGINGVVPQISLSYNSQSGPGLAGYGWNVSGISKITRIPKTKFHDGTIEPVDYLDDRFALDGERLVVKKGTSGVYGANGTQYETENFSNVKITSYTNPSYPNSGPVYFLVEYPDGSKAHYGWQTSTSSPLIWGITYWENAQGINIHYENYGEQIYKITYGSRGSATPINEIKFNYQPRSRKENYYIGGVNYIKSDKLSEIEIKSNNIGFRNYSLEYTQSSQNYDQLSKITEKNGDKSKSYNPTVFQYNTTESTINYIPNPNTLDVNNVSSINASTVSGDFDGDGAMDFILYPTTGSDAKKNTGSLPVLALILVPKPIQTLDRKYQRNTVLMKFSRFLF